LASNEPRPEEGGEIEIGDVEDRSGLRGLNERYDKDMSKEGK
jgi:hypothetical protein